MELIDNINKTLALDLKETIKPGSKISIAASCFSIYAYQELKKQLENIDQLQFIFTSPTFTTEKAKKEKREFYIPKLNRERSLYGTEFEVKLRNELSQKAIAKECAEWIKNKAVFKSNQTNQVMSGFVNVDDTSYMPIQGFTTVDLGCEKGNNAYNIVNKIEAPLSMAYLQLFEQLWNDKEKLKEVTDVVIDNITSAYNENAPEFIYFVTLYNIFNEFLEDISEDVLPNEGTGFKNSVIWNKLYNFQKDAARAIINKLEKYNGCILADSVGLGKTFTALAVIKYYETRNKNVLVLCPKKLSDNWNTYRDNYSNNPLIEDRLNYKVLYHTDIGRSKGFSNGTDLGRLRWDTYDLIVIDESHNFRNGGKLEPEEDEKLNRYAILLKDVIRRGVKTKVLMLSATPVNNRFNDLKNQLRLAYEGNSVNLDEQLNTTHTIDDIFRQAQTAFNTWSKWSPEDRTTSNLLKMLDFDFFEVLDSVTIARSRKHIEKFYDTSSIGKFPTRRKPISLRPNLTDLAGAIGYNQIFEELVKIPSPSLCEENVARKIMEYTYNNGINAYFQKEGLSLFGPNGKENPYLAVMVSVLGVCAQMERENIVFRLNSGRTKYIADGGKMGRKVGSCKSREQKQEEYNKVIRSLRAGKSVRDTAKICGVSVSTVQRVKKEFQI